MDSIKFLCGMGVKQENLTIQNLNKALKGHLEWFRYDGEYWRIRNPFFGVLLEQFATELEAKTHRLAYLIKSGDLPVTRLNKLRI